MDIKEVLEGSCRHVIPMLKEKCKILLSKFESKIITEIYNKHSSKDICTVDLKNMCSIKQYLDIQDNSDEILQFDDIFTDDSDIDEDDLVIRDDDI